MDTRYQVGDRVRHTYIEPGGYRYGYEGTTGVITAVHPDDARPYADQLSISRDDTGKFFGCMAFEVAPIDGINPSDRWESPAPERDYYVGGGFRDSQVGKDRFDLISPLGMPYDEQLLTRIARHMADGAEKYEDRNWEDFSDDSAAERARSSAFRHFMQWYYGVDDGEDHAAAVYFNIQAAEFIEWKRNEALGE